MKEKLRGRSETNGRRKGAKTPRNLSVVKTEETKPIIIIFVVEEFEED